MEGVRMPREEDVDRNLNDHDRFMIKCVGWFIVICAVGFVACVILGFLKIAVQAVITVAAILMFIALLGWVGIEKIKNRRLEEKAGEGS